MKRRVLSLIMALVILLTMLPTSALAQEMETPAAGAPVEKTAKDVSKAADPTTAPTVAVTASTEGSVPATEDSVLPTKGDIAPQNGEGIAVYSSGPVAKVGDTEYETLNEILAGMEPVDITLLDDVSEPLAVYATTTINMDGHTISSDIEAYDSLTLTNGTV